MGDKFPELTQLLQEAGMVAALQGLGQHHTEGTLAVDGILFNLVPGEIVGFLGSNGAGKTPTLKMLSG